MEAILNEERLKEMRTEDVLAKICTYLYFADFSNKQICQNRYKSQILHLGLLIDNMNNEIKTPAPYYEVVNTVCNEEIS